MAAEEALPVHSPDLEARLIGEAIIGDELEGLRLAYNFGYFKPQGSEDSFEVAILRPEEDYVLVAFPGSAWNRRVNSRKLPAGTLNKALSLRVAGAKAEDRLQADPSILVDIWIGWCARSLLTGISFDEGLFADYRFLDTTTSEPCFPFAEAMANVVADKFRPQTPAAPPEEDRLRALEVGFQSLEASMQRLLAMQEQGGSGFATAAEEVIDGRQPAKAAAPPKKTVHPPPGLEENYPGLDPGTVASALQAGVPKHQLRTMSSLVSQRPKIAELPNGKVPPPVVELDEEPDEDEWLNPVPGQEAPAPSDSMAQAVVQLTKIVSKLSSKSDEVADCLAESGSGGVGDLTSFQSRRHSATLAALKKALKLEPKKIFTVVERNMAEQFQLASSLPNTSGHFFTVRGWLEHRSKVQAYPRTVRHAWSTAGALDCLIEGRPEECRARLCLMMAQMEQEALDHGNALLSQEFSLEPAPPFSSFVGHVIPDPVEMAYTRLMHPTWVEACAHRLKEVDTYNEMRKKLGQKPKPSGASAADAGAKGSQKGAKGKGKKKGSDAKSSEAEQKES